MGVEPVVTGPWSPLSPAGVKVLLGGADRPWLVAGGWAIDLFVGRQTRRHADIDVLVLRADQQLIQERLHDWQIFAADPPGTLRRWRPGETLPTSVHDIWCRENAEGPWRVQFMIDDSDGSHWVSRRDPRIRMSLADTRRVSPSGIPYLAPEVQLLYKSRSPRPKDEHDLHATIAHLGPAQRTVAPRRHRTNLSDTPLAGTADVLICRLLVASSFDGSVRMVSCRWLSTPRTPQPSASRGNWLAGRPMCGGT